MMISTPFRTCLLAPEPKIFDAARLLDDAVTAHLEGKTEVATDLFLRTNSPEIRNWTEKLWGRGSGKRYRIVPKSPKPAGMTLVPAAGRMPTKADKQKIITRDGYHCRFCGIPVIREEVRSLIRSYDCYREAVPWGTTNATQHAAFQAMWLHYDHIVPHSLAGPSTVANMIVCCAPCNCARMESTLAEVGLFDPRDRDPVRSEWDGLERFR